jgi:hypothetical protein
MRVKVEAYSGCAANERPLRFTLGERCLEVQDILDRWYSEDARYFRVRADDGDTYVLKYLQQQDTWELASFTGKHSRGSQPQAPIDKTLH